MFGFLVHMTLNEDKSLSNKYQTAWFSSAYHTKFKTNRFTDVGIQVNTKRLYLLGELLGLSSVVMLSFLNRNYLNKVISLMVYLSYNT